MTDFVKIFPDKTLEGYTIKRQLINRFGEVEGIVIKDPEGNRNYSIYFGEDTEIGDYT